MIISMLKKTRWWTLYLLDVNMFRDHHCEYVSMLTLACQSTKNLPTSKFSWKSVESFLCRQTTPVFFLFFFLPQALLKMHSMSFSYTRIWVSQAKRSWASFSLWINHHRWWKSTWLMLMRKRSQTRKCFWGSLTFGDFLHNSTFCFGF